MWILFRVDDVSYLHVVVFHLSYVPAEVGLAMISLGMMLSLLGTMLFFEKNLLRLGNVSFHMYCILFSLSGSNFLFCQVLLLGGSTCLVGPSRVVQFFANPKRFQSTIIFFLGS